MSFRNFSSPSVQTMKISSMYRHQILSGLSDVKIELIDQVNGNEQLREMEGQWAYRLKTLFPNGLNDNDFFFVKNKRFRRT